MAPTMTETLGVAEAKRRFSELIERVRSGEHFVVTRRGKPVMALVPPAAARTEMGEKKPAGLLALVGVLEDWDWDHEEFVKEIYSARRKARDRSVPEIDLG